MCGESARGLALFAHLGAYCRSRPLVLLLVCGSGGRRRGALLTVQEDCFDDCALESDGFAAFYARYYQPLLRYVVSQFGSRDAEEITAETMSRLFACFDSLPASGKSWSWLTVTARRIGVDLWRDRRPFCHVNEEFLDRAAAVPGLDDALLAKEEAARVHVALGRLSASQQRFIKLRYLEGMSYTDISGLLARTEVSVRQQVCRARAKLHSEFCKLEQDVGALIPVGLIVAMLRRLRVKAAHGPTAAASVATSLAVVGSAVWGLGGGALWVGAVLTDPAMDGSSVVRASSQQQLEHAAVPPPPAVTRAAAATSLPQGATGALVDVRREAGPVTVKMSVGPKPFKPGAHRDQEVSVQTPVGRVVLATASDNDREPRAICTLPVVDCS